MIAAALGWIGTVGTFVAYLLLCRGRLLADSLRYGMLNTSGGLLAGTAAVLYGAWPSAASNFAWAVIGMVSVFTAVKRISAGGAERATRSVTPIRSAGLEVPHPAATENSADGLCASCSAPRAAA
jgi:hypothetical protein